MKHCARRFVCVPTGGPRKVFEGISADRGDRRIIEAFACPVFWSNRAKAGPIAQAVRNLLSKADKDLNWTDCNRLCCCCWWMWDSGVSSTTRWPHQAFLLSFHGIWFHQAPENRKSNSICWSLTTCRVAPTQRCASTQRLKTWSPEQHNAQQVPMPRSNTYMEQKYQKPHHSDFPKEHADLNIETYLVKVLSISRDHPDWVQGWESVCEEGIQQTDQKGHCLISRS